MVVDRQSFPLILERLKAAHTLSLDTETTGLRPYHGDRLFSLIIGYQAEAGPDTAYFNFWSTYPGLAPDFVLSTSHLRTLNEELFSDRAKLWFIHNFNFDLHMLHRAGVEVQGTIHCTLNIGRLVHNNLLGYGLAESLERIGERKLDTVEKWIEDNHAWEWEGIPGKKQRKKNKFYFKVPWDIIVPYARQDALGGYQLGLHQEKSIEEQSTEFGGYRPNLNDLLATERRLAKTVYRMERVGVRIDRSYCTRAAAFEESRSIKAQAAFKRESGRDYAQSPKLFAEVFGDERDKWSYTEKGNPSFESDALSRLVNPAAKHILEVRDAKSKSDFYHGFLYHADEHDRIHPNFNPGRTATGRFSSSNPNLQNLTSEEDDALKEEFVVRRAIVPTPGFVFFLPDWKAMEYCMMLDYAKDMAVQEFKGREQPYSEDYFEVANQVAEGADIHQATCDTLIKLGFGWFTRKMAKTLNFGLLYGMGAQALADALEVDLEKGKEIKRAYFKALPYVQGMIRKVTDTIEKRGWLHSWDGRKFSFDDRGDAYKGPNYLIQGGCAGVAKKAMNAIDELLLQAKSRLLLTIHDELPCEIHESEMGEYPKKIVVIMESVYPHKYVPLKVSPEWSGRSLADKVAGLPA